MFRLLETYLRTQNTFRSIPILSEKPPKMCPISGFGAIFQTKTGCTFKQQLILKLIRTDIVLKVSGDPHSTNETLTLQLSIT